jgi:lactonase family protein with 7-bladed beta-propeller/Big-like domain-containing protein
MEINMMASFRRLLQVLPLIFSLIGLASCFNSAVTDLLITSVDLAPANPTLAIGATQQFILSATFVGGSTDKESPNNMDWLSDNLAVATISKMGIATAVGAGTAHIIGSYHGNNAKTLLTVTAAAGAVAIAADGDSRVLNVTNLRTGHQMTFAADSLRDSIMVSGGGGRTGATELEISVLPERGPAWLAVDPAARYLYVVNHTSESVSVFAINWKTGMLTAVPFSPFSAGAKPWSVAVDPDGSGVVVKHFQSAEISRFRVDPTTGTLKPFGEN